MKTLKNGAYIATMNRYDSKRRVSVYNGVASIFTMQGVFLTSISQEELEANYHTFQRITRANSLYNLVWIYRGEVKDYLVQNANYALCSFKKKIFEKNPQYKTGFLAVQPSMFS